MHARLGISNCFAVKRWPPPAMVLIETILSERAVARAPVQLCLDLGHPFVCGGSPRTAIAEVQLQQPDGLGDHHWCS